MYRYNFTPNRGTGTRTVEKISSRRSIGCGGCFELFLIICCQTSTNNFIYSLSIAVLARVLVGIRVRVLQVALSLSKLLVKIHDRSFPFYTLNVFPYSTDIYHIVIHFILDFDTVRLLLLLLATSTTGTTAPTTDS
jgi:hypothetical protein